MHAIFPTYFALDNTFDPLSVISSLKDFPDFFLPLSSLYMVSIIYHW